MLLFLHFLISSLNLFCAPIPARLSRITGSRVIEEGEYIRVNGNPSYQTRSRYVNITSMPITPFTQNELDSVCGEDQDSDRFQLLPFLHMRNNMKKIAALIAAIKAIKLKIYNTLAKRRSVAPLHSTL